MLVPNVITLLAIFAGLTAIRLATEGRMELAVAAIVFAAVLDGIDGRVARMIKGQSRFGAELDSLADFVNFGVAPGLILYCWQLHELKMAAGSPRWCSRSAADCGWRDSMRPSTIQTRPVRGEILHRASSACRRITVLLPIYFEFLELAEAPDRLTALYTLLIAFLMVSRLPVFSARRRTPACRRKWCSRFSSRSSSSSPF